MNGGYNKIFAVDYRADGTWNAPYLSYALSTTNNTAVPGIHVTTNGNINYLTASNPLPLTAWTHLAGTYDGSALRIYLNGEQDQHSLAATGQIDYGTSNDVAIGYDSIYESSVTEGWVGLLDELRISNVARSADWVAAEFANQSSPSMFYTLGGQATPISAPTIQFLSPSAAPIGALVTIQGAGFQSTQGASTVAFIGAAATPASWNDASIVVPVPVGAPTGNVTVSVGGVVSNGVNFTVLPTPSITTLSPNVGPVGTVVTITGVNFGSAQGTSTVTFAGTVATPTYWSPTTITVSAPTGAATGNVIVTVGGRSK